MKRTRMKTLIRLSGVLALFLFVAGCEPEKAAPDEPDTADANFIPQKGKKFIYKIETEGSAPSIATQWISDQKDSSGITVYNLHTLLESPDFTMNMDNRLFSLAGKTYNEKKVPEFWNQIIQMLRGTPGITVTKAELVGFPAFITMENVIRENSHLSQAGPDIQGQRVEYTNNGEAASMEQQLELIPGFSKVETVVVPAGSFVCNKFTYSTASTTTITTKDDSYTSNGNENITVWVAHGVGIVKQVAASKLVTVVVLPTGEIKEIITDTNSIMTLEEIK